MHARSHRRHRLLSRGAAGCVAFWACVSTSVAASAQRNGHDVGLLPAAAATTVDAEILAQIDEVLSTALAEAGYALVHGHRLDQRMRTPAPAIAATCANNFGCLAKHARRARLATLVLTRVSGNDPATIELFVLDVAQGIVRAQSTFAASTEEELQLALARDFERVFGVATPPTLAAVQKRTTVLAELPLELPETGPSVPPPAAHATDDLGSVAPQQPTAPMIAELELEPPAAAPPTSESQGMWRLYTGVGLMVASLVCITIGALAYRGAQADYADAEDPGLDGFRAGALKQSGDEQIDRANLVGVGAGGALATAGASFMLWHFVAIEF